MREIKTKLLVQLGEYSALTPDDLAKGDPQTVAGNLVYFHKQLNDTYTVVGEADVTIRLRDGKELIDAKVEQLNAQLKRAQADAEVECNRIRGQIQNLLAISYTPEA